MCTGRLLSFGEAIKRRHKNSDVYNNYDRRCLLNMKTLKFKGNIHLNFIIIPCTTSLASMPVPFETPNLFPLECNYSRVNKEFIE